MREVCPDVVGLEEEDDVGMDEDVALMVEVTAGREAVRR